MQLASAMQATYGGLVSELINTYSRKQPPDSIRHQSFKRHQALFWLAGPLHSLDKSLIFPVQVHKIKIIPDFSPQSTQIFKKTSLLLFLSRATPDPLCNFPFFAWRTSLKAGLPSSLHKRRYVGFHLQVPCLPLMQQIVALSSCISEATLHPFHKCLPYS